MYLNKTNSKLLILANSIAIYCYSPKPLLSLFISSPIPLAFLILCSDCSTTF